MAKEDLMALPDFKEFADHDLKILEESSWERLAYAVWHDAVKSNDPMNSQKWAAMISARLLKSIADDSRAIKFLSWVLVVLTAVLCVDVVVRLIRH